MILVKSLYKYEYIVVLRGDFMGKIVDSSMKYWLDANCSRTTACGILDFYNYPVASEVLFKSFATFGSGLQERLVCGSVIGSLAALNYILSEKGLSPQEISDKSIEFKTAFRKKFGTIHCADLLYPDLKILDPYPDEPKRLEICTKTVEHAVKEVEKIIESIK